MALAFKSLSTVRAICRPHGTSTPGGRPACWFFSERVSMALSPPPRSFRKMVSLSLPLPRTRVLDVSFLLFRVDLTVVAVRFRAWETRSQTCRCSATRSWPRSASTTAAGCSRPSTLSSSPSRRRATSRYPHGRARLSLSLPLGCLPCLLLLARHGCLFFISPPRQFPPIPQIVLFDGVVDALSLVVMYFPLI